MPASVVDGFQCARCGLPLFVSAVSQEDKRLRIWHVHATGATPDPSKVVLDLKVNGRRGCTAPVTLVAGTPWITPP